MKRGFTAETQRTRKRKTSKQETSHFLRVLRAFAVTHFFHREGREGREEDVFGFLLLLPDHRVSVVKQAMPNEIEAKMKVETFDAVRRRLEELGARRVGKVLETNTFFDTPDGRLVREGKGLRVRDSRDMETGKHRHVVTFKGPQGKEELKNREEIEFSVDDGEAAAALLRAIGFEMILSFEKRRETWELDDCEVVLDELPILGWFVEIEGPDESGVMNLHQKLGLSDRPLIQTAYATMLAQRLEKSGNDKRRVTF